MMRLKLFSQSGSVLFAWNVEKLWTYEGSPIGIDADRAGNVMLVNGVYDGDGVGNVYLSKLEIECDYPITCPPRAGWFVQGNKLTIGSGLEMLPTGSALTIRTRWNPEEIKAPERWEMHGCGLPLSFVRDDTEWKFLEALRTGAPEQYSGGVLPTLMETGCGMWRPAGRASSDSNYGGGWRVEPVSGFERSPVLAMIRDDCVAERQRVWCVHARTGEPVTNPETYGRYALTRGWTRDVKLPFNTTPTTGNLVVPKSFNEGSCPYEARLTARTDIYSQFQETDGQHGIRRTSSAKAAALLWNDGPAKRRLAMYAAESLYAYQGPISARAHNGSSGIAREYAWVVDTLRAVRHPRTPEFENAMIASQMPTGQCMREASDKQNWIPSPYVTSPDVPNPYPLTTDTMQVFEGWYHAHNFFVGGHPRNARLLVETAFNEAALKHGGTPPRHYGVGTKGGAAFAELDGRSVPKNYDYYVALGEAMWHFGKDWAEQYVFRMPIPDQGIPTNWADARAKMLRSETARSQLVAAMGFAETMP
jgi:hypothetical protein